MKTKSLSIILLAAFLLALVTCKKELDPNIETFEITKENLMAGTTSVTIEGTYNYPGVIDGIKACVSENGASFREFDVELEEKDFSVTITGLTPATEYQYHYAVDYGFEKPFITETKTFTTLNTEKPTMRALEWLKIDSTTYRIKCQVVADGGSEVTERGICWNTFGSPIPHDDNTQTYDGDAEVFEEYSVRMEHLDLGKKYYVRAYAKNAAGKTGLSEEVLDFETEAPAGTSVEINLECNPEQGGTVTGGGTYEVGTQCTAKAVANSGYTFINWTENGNQVSSEATYTFPVTVGRNLVANFTKQAYVITAEVTPENGGTVTGAGGYNYNEECTLTAAPNTGYEFVKWTKGGSTVSTQTSYTFTVTETAEYEAHFKIKSYTINVSANPENGGSVEGGGTYNYGEECRAQATPADGFAIVNWTDDGEVVSTDANYPFTVTSNRNLVANFTELQSDEYSIQVSANPPEGGTVTGGGTYTQGASCTVNATKNTGYHFVNWTENGIQVSVLAEYEFTVEGNRVLVANFEAEAPSEYTVTVSAYPSNGGTVTGGGTYQQGQQCTVTATENVGYTFINWTENGNEVSPNASITFIVNSDRNLVANFTINSYTINLSADPTNGGTVSGGGTYNHGQTCPANATANNGYTFSNWTENDNVVSTQANYSFTVTGNRTLKANFTVQAPNTYNINVSANPPAGGTVTGSGSYQQGHSCTVTATENAGYTFLRWTENDNTVPGAGASYTFTVTGNRTLVAQFQIQSYTITTQVDPTGSGTVTGGGTYNHGQQCTLAASANNNAQYEFDHWTKNGSSYAGGATITFNVTESATYTAHFRLKQYSITATANPTNGGTISGNQSPYNYGQTCSLTATPASGYTFLRWTENGSQVSTNPNYSFTVTSNRTLVAQFQQQQYTITATANPTNGGTATVSGNGTFTYNQQCTLTATPNDHYSFTNWKKGNNVVSTNAIYTFQVTESASYTANFTQDPQYTISASANPTNGGSVSGGGTYYQDETCNLTATSANGYTFTNWTENGNVVSSQTSYTFTVNSNRTLVANFTQIVVPTVTTSAVTNIQQTTATGGGNVTNSGGATVTERGICWSTSQNPSLTNGSHQQASSGGTGIFIVNMTNLTPGTTYYVKAYATNSAGTGYGSQVTFTTLSSGGGHAYVDLGLPSGTLWATCNVGATNPEDYGDYFAWGETQPNKSDYSMDTYQYCNGSASTLTKYCNNASYGYNGFTDNLTVLEASDDAATAHWGNGWRMPTQAEWQELLNNTTNIWTTQNGVNGRLFTASNGNSLFLPAAGYYYGTSLYGAGSYGHFWSSSLDTDLPNYAWELRFDMGYCSMGRSYRSNGFTVRPVRSSRQN